MINIWIRNHISKYVDNPTLYRYSLISSEFYFDEEIKFRKAYELGFFELIENSDLASIKLLYNRGVYCDPTYLLHASIRRGYLFIVKWILKNGNIYGMLNDIYDRPLIDVASDWKNLDIAKWLWKNNFKSVAEPMNIAARNNDSDLFTWLHHNVNKGYCNYALEYFSSYGNLNMVKFIYDNRFERGTTNTINIAATIGNLELVIFFEEKGLKCTGEALQNSAINNHINIVKYLHKNFNLRIKGSFLSLVAGKGHLDMFIWLLNNLDEVVSERNLISSMENASQNNHMNIVQYLYNNYFIDWQSKTLLHSSVYSNNVDIVKFMFNILKLGKYYTKKCYETAVILENKEIMNFFENNVKNFHKFKYYCTIGYAAEKGNMDIIIHLVEDLNIHVKSYDILNAISIKANNIIYYLLKKIDPKEIEEDNGEIMNEAIICENFEIVKFFNENYSMQYNPLTFDLMIKKNSYSRKMAKYLLKYSKEQYITKNTVIECCRKNNLDCLRLLYDEFPNLFINTKVMKNYLRQAIMEYNYIIVHWLSIRFHY